MKNGVCTLKFEDEHTLFSLYIGSINNLSDSPGIILIEQFSQIFSTFRTVIYNSYGSSYIAWPAFPIYSIKMEGIEDCR